MGRRTTRLVGELAEVRGAAPRIKIYETDAASNNGFWDIIATGEDLLFRTRTDADGAGVTFLTVARTGTTPDSVTINPDGADINFIVESDTNTTAFSVDAGANSGAGAAGFGATSITDTYLMMRTPAWTTPNDTGFNHTYVSPTNTITATGTAPGIYLLRVGQATLSGTVTTAASFYVDAQPTGGSVTNRYAIFSDAGLNRFDGDGTVVFELPADATDPTSGGGAATGRIPVKIGGSTVYLAYY